MKSEDRLLGVWNALTVYVVAPLTLLSVVLRWSGAVQLVLTLAMLVAVTAPLVVLRWSRRRR